MVLICREALEDSVLGQVALAETLAQAGRETAVVFTGEALHALAEGTFRWSPNFKTREAQAAIIAAAEASGLPLGHALLDHRWSDVRGMVAAVANRSRVRFIACPVWAELLRLGDGLPHLERLSRPAYAALLADAKQIVGAY